MNTSNLALSTQTTEMNPFQTGEMKTPPSSDSVKKKKKTKPINLQTFLLQTPSAPQTEAAVSKPLTNPEELEKTQEEEPKVIRALPQASQERINSSSAEPQYVLIRKVANDILFSQSTVSDFNRVGNCDYPISMLADQLFCQYRRDVEKFGDGALDIVEIGDGKYMSIDNRRLLIAKKIGVVDRTYGIWVKVHQKEDLIRNPLELRRFNGARTWGEALKNRTTSPKGHTPMIMSGPVKSKKQTICLSVNCDLTPLHPEDIASIKARSVNGSIEI